MSGRRGASAKGARARVSSHVRGRVRYRDLFVLDPDLTVDTLPDRTIRNASRASLEADAWAPRWLLYAGGVALALMAVWLIREESDLMLLALAWATLIAAAILLIQTARAPANGGSGIADDPHPNHRER